MFTYVVRSMIARLGSNLITALAIGLVVAGCLIELAFLRGFEQAISQSADPESVIVLSDNATTEMSSTVSNAAIHFLEVLPEIARGEDGKPLLSVELKASLMASIQPLKGRRVLNIRGVDSVAYTTHHVEIVQGRRPQPGTNEIAIGRALVDTYPELGRIDESMVEGGRRVVGIFAASGAVFENEIWMDRGRMTTDLRAPEPNIVIFRAKRASDVPNLIAQIASNRVVPLRAQSERAFREATLNLRNIYRMVMLLVVLLSAVAIFTTTTALHASFVARLKEFAILTIIGLPWRTVAGMIVKEALTLTAVGVMIGWLLSLALNGANVATLLGSEVAFKLSVDWRILLTGVGAGLMIGLIGAMFPTIMLRKMDVLQASR